MKTELTESVLIAADFIRAGEVVAFPTETVYGLGASVFDETAIARIFAAKGRPGDNPLIAHIAAVEQLELLAREIPPAARLLIDNFFPGPLTVILPKRDEVPLLATGGLATIGVRMPDHPLAHQFLQACGVPLVAPSANISGRPSPTTWQAVYQDLNGRIACILCGEPTRVGLESTVVDCTAVMPVVLRAGAITIEQLRTVIPGISLADHRESAVPKSPGMKYRHYSLSVRPISDSMLHTIHRISSSSASAWMLVIMHAVSSTSFGNVMPPGSRRSTASPSRVKGWAWH